MEQRWPMDAGLSKSQESWEAEEWQSPLEQEVALGRGPCPGTRSLAHLRASQGLGRAQPCGHQAPHLQASVSAPKVRLEWRIPPGGSTPGPLWLLIPVRHGTPNHTGGHEAGPPQCHPQASGPPPGLPASRPPTGAGHPAVLLPHSKTWEGPLIPWASWGQALGWALRMPRRRDAVPRRLL